MQAINAGTGILIARLLLPAGRGELAAITLWSQFLAGLITFGLPSALIYYIRNRPRETKEILVNALLMSTLLSILAGVVGFAFMPTWLHQYPPWAIHSARWFLIVTPLVSAAVILRSALEATGSFTTSNLAQILNPTMTLLFLLVLLSFHHFDTFTAACAYIAAAIPVLVLLVWRAWHLFSRRHPLHQLSNLKIAPWVWHSFLRDRPARHSCASSRSGSSGELPPSSGPWHICSDAESLTNA